jgi:FkbM family methyltransferase
MAMKNYSQNNEQQVILDYFKGKVGTFISLGENDGETFSNVRALVLSGWRGVMVEPSPKAFERLKALYRGHKGIYIYPYAISGHNGKAILQESGPLCSAADVGLVSTFHAHEMDRFKRSVSYEPVEIRCFKWKTFLNRLSIKEFDFISLDIEGEEMNVLPDMDLSKTSMICIEWNSNANLKSAYKEYLDGFNLLYVSAENLIYAR